MADYGDDGHPIDEPDPEEGVDFEICEVCEARVDSDKAVPCGTLIYYCESCAEDAAAEARTTPMRHVDPTECDWAGMMSDCDGEVEENELLCPKCGEDMEEEPRG